MSGAKPSKPSKRDRARRAGKAARPPRLPAAVGAYGGGGGTSGGGSGAIADGRRSMEPWPVIEAFVNAGWDAAGGGLATVYIARHHPRYDTIEIGIFLVDLQCLGVKSASRRRARDTAAYEREIRPVLFSALPDELVPITPELAAKIVLGGLAYAADLGFEPDPDFKDARIVLDGLDPDGDPTPVPLGGPDGKPHYIAGPYDEAGWILAQLGARLGPDDFHYIAPVDLLDDFDDDDYIDDIDDIDDDDESDAGGFLPLDLRCPELAEAEKSYIVVSEVIESGDPDDDLDPGRYPLRELYCTDPDCQCQRVVLYVLPTDAADWMDMYGSGMDSVDMWPEATISFSWADDDALQRWIGGPKMSLKELAAQRGPDLDDERDQGPAAGTSNPTDVIDVGAGASGLDLAFE